MIYIGVTGKSGAGKSTFSNFWATKSNVGVIHFDDLVDEFKMKYFKFFMEKNNEDKPVKVNSKLKKFLYSNKITFNLLMKFRDRITRKAFERRVQELKSKGKEIIVIDDWMLATHKGLCEKCKRVYIVGRKFTQRREGLQKRDSATIEETKVIDIPYALGYVKRPRGLNVEVINNYGSLDDLRIVVDEKYQEIGVLGFDEKYRINDKGVMDRLRQVSKGGDVINKLLHGVRRALEEKDE